MWIRIMSRNDHKRALLSIPRKTFFICGIALPALWTIVTEANIRHLFQDF